MDMLAIIIRPGVIIVIAAPQAFRIPLPTAGAPISSANPAGNWVIERELYLAGFG